MHCTKSDYDHSNRCISNYHKPRYLLDYNKNNINCALCNIQIVTMGRTIKRLKKLLLIKKNISVPIVNLMEANNFIGFIIFNGFV